MYLVKHHTLVVADPPAPILMKDPPSVFLAIKQCKNLGTLYFTAEILNVSNAN